MGGIIKFTDLLAWKEGHKLVVEIYRITTKFPKTEYSLIDQMRRVAVSMTSNIAEGFGRLSIREKIQFYYVAHGSLTELKNQLMICKDINIIDSTLYTETNNQLISAHKLLQGLIKKSKSFLTS